MICGSLNIKALWDVFMCMHTSSRGKINRSHRKSEFQTFSLTSGRHVGAPQRYSNMASPY